jgi:hypothetical protein
MTEEPRRHSEPADEPPLTLDEIVDRAGRRVASALVAAGALVGLAIYWQPAPPRYQMVASGNQVLRIDTRKGTIIGCEAEECATILHHGQHLSSHLTIDAPSRPAALPAPAAAPASASTPAPAAPAAQPAR